MNRVRCLFSGLAVAMATMGLIANAIGQEELILGQQPGEPQIKGRVSCAELGGPTHKVKCPTITDEEAEACPTGPCFEWENRGCTYYPPVNATPKRYQRIKINDTAEYDYPTGVAKNLWGKKVEEKPNSRVVCYEETQCYCHVDEAGNATCKTRDPFVVAIVEYGVTNEPCIGVGMPINDLD